MIGTSPLNEIRIAEDRERRNKRRRDKARNDKAQHAALYALVKKPGALAASQAPAKKRPASRRSATAGNHQQGSKWIRRERRIAIYERDGWRCVWCGCVVVDGRTMKAVPIAAGDDRQLATLDHFLARCRGGTNLSSNLLTSCMQCNHDRDHLSALEWAAKLEAKHVVYGVAAGFQTPARWSIATMLERCLRALERPIVKLPKVALP